MMTLQEPATVLPSTQAARSSLKALVSPGEIRAQLADEEVPEFIARQVLERDAQFFDG
jgi:hypothetical protein